MLTEGKCKICMNNSTQVTGIYDGTCLYMVLYSARLLIYVVKLILFLIQILRILFSAVPQNVIRPFLK